MRTLLILTLSLTGLLATATLAQEITVIPEHTLTPEQRQEIEQNESLNDIGGIVREALRHDKTVGHQTTSWILCSGDIRQANVPNTFVGEMKCYSNYSSDRNVVNKPAIQATFQANRVPGLPVLTTFEGNTRCQKFVYTPAPQGQKLDVTCNDNATSISDKPATSAIRYSLTYTRIEG